MRNDERGRHLRVAALVGQARNEAQLQDVLKDRVGVSEQALHGQEQSLDFRDATLAQGVLDVSDEVAEEVIGRRGGIVRIGATKLPPFLLERRERAAQGALEKRSAHARSEGWMERG